MRQHFDEVSPAEAQTLSQTSEAGQTSEVLEKRRVDNSLNWMDWRVAHDSRSFKK